MPGSYGARAGNDPVASVHPEQMEWLKNLLEGATFEYSEFDEDGNFIKKYPKPYNTLKRKCLYYTNPLSAVVTVDEEGNISIDGMDGDWLYGITPKIIKDGVKPFIPNRKAKINI